MVIPLKIHAIGISKKRVILLIEHGQGKAMLDSLSGEHIFTRKKTYHQMQDENQCKHEELLESIVI